MVQINLHQFYLIDKSAGIYVYRWGDAPIRSMAIFTFANTSVTHYYENIGYTHTDRWHCVKKKL